MIDAENVENDPILEEISRVKKLRLDWFTKVFKVVGADAAHEVLSSVVNQIITYYGEAGYSRGDLNKYIVFHVINGSTPHKNREYEIDLSGELSIEKKFVDLYQKKLEEVSATA
jgi:hypothetical protein